MFAYQIAVATRKSKDLPISSRYPFPWLFLGVGKTIVGWLLCCGVGIA